MSAVRYAKSERRYRNALKNNHGKDLRTEELVAEFKYFLIVLNRFPQDRILQTHHLLVPKRTITSWMKMNRRERKEFKKIFNLSADKYDAIKLNFQRNITVKELVHWHLIVYKEG